MEHAVISRDNAEITLIYQADDEIREWLISHSFPAYGPCHTLGFARDGRLIGAVIYFHHNGLDIELGIHTISPKWCSRRTLFWSFAYPFLQLNCARVTVKVDAKDEKVCNFVERVGFEREGILRRAIPSGDSAVYGLLKEECRWLHGRISGRRIIRRIIWR